MDLILKHRGNYKALLTFKKATIIYDLTYHFATHYLSRGDRTVDQMIQAARSGKQNIAEGVAASSTNAETEIKLVNVAKASLKELLTDFEDYLRTRRLPQWEMGSRELEWVREKGKTELESAFWLSIAEKRDDAVVANIAIVLLKQEDYLLFKQLEALEKQFKASGDLRGRLKDASSDIRESRHKEEEREAMTFGYPRCPKCGKVMTRGDEVLPDGRIVVRWSCRDCKTEQIMELTEFRLIERERYRKIDAVKLKYKEFYRDWVR